MNSTVYYSYYMLMCVYVYVTSTINEQNVLMLFLQILFQDKFGLNKHFCLINWILNVYLRTQYNSYYASVMLLVYKYINIIILIL